MPRHDFSPRLPRPDPGGRPFTPGLNLRTLAMVALMRLGRRGKGSGKGDPDIGGVPVDPNRPKGLSGGAAAPLEFDD